MMDKLEQLIKEILPDGNVVFENNVPEEPKIVRRQLSKIPTEEERRLIDDRRKELILKNHHEMNDLVHECVICKKAISKTTILENAFIVNNNGEKSGNLIHIDKYVKVCGDECRKLAIYSVYPYDNEIVGMTLTDGVYLLDGLGECNIPELLTGFSKNYYPEEIKKRIEDWVINTTNKSMWFKGYPGTGKTGMAISHIIESRRREKSAYFVKFYDLVEEILKLKLGHSGTLIKKYTKFDILVIDDISQSYITDYGKSVLFNLFGNLYENNKRLIVTSNYDHASIAEWIDGRLLGRFNAYFKIVDFGETNMRK